MALQHLQEHAVRVSAWSPRKTVSIWYSDDNVIVALQENWRQAPWSRKLWDMAYEFGLLNEYESRLWHAVITGRVELTGDPMDHPELGEAYLRVLNVNLSVQLPRPPELGTRFERPAIGLIVPDTATTKRVVRVYRVYEHRVAL